MAVRSCLIIINLIIFLSVVSSLRNCGQSEDDNNTSVLDTVTNLFNSTSILRTSTLKIQMDSINFTLGPHTNLDSVTTLILSASESIFIDMDSLRSFPNLQALLIQGEKTGNGSLPTLSLSDKIFSLLSNTSTICLDTLLLELHSNTFYDLDNLYKISINKCELQVISKEVFVPNSVKYLAITESNMEDIGWINWYKIQPIQVNLSNNLLSTFLVNNNATYSIQTLDLSYNKMYSVDASTFSVADDLITLILKGNFIKYLDRNTLEKFTTIKKLDISQNGLNCSCLLDPFVKWIKVNTITLENINETKCANSSSERTLQFDSFMKSHNIMCESSTEVTPTSTRITKQETTATNTTTNTPKTMKGISKSVTSGIIAGVIILALFLISLVAILLFTRHRKFASWSPGDQEILIENSTRHPKIRNRKRTVLDIDNPYEEINTEGSFVQREENISTSENSMPINNSSLNHAYIPDTDGEIMHKSGYILENDSSVMKGVEDSDFVQSGDVNDKNMNSKIGVASVHSAERSEETGESVPMVELYRTNSN